MYLTTNYRSCEEIIHASNILISYSDNYSQMPMKGLRAGGVVKAIPVRNKNDIVEYYLNHISPDRKVLVLCSTNNECKNLSSAFIDQLVPVSLVYAITYDLLHALKNFISAIIRHDINYVPYALSVLKQKQLQQVTEKEIKYAYKKLRAIGEKENAYLPLREYFNELNSIEADINVFDILDDAYISSIEKAFQYLRIYLDSSDIERKSIISRFDDNNQSNANVKVSTIHTAKGSESPIVILDGTSFRKTTRRPITDEDIRTLYVAMTRAKSELYFMHNDDISEKSNALEYYVYSAIQEALSRPVKRAM